MTSETERKIQFALLGAATGVVAVIVWVAIRGGVG